MKIKKIFVSMLIPVMVLAMTPVIGYADDAKTVKLGETVTVSGYDKEELKNALDDYSIEGVDDEDVEWIEADGWSEEPVVCKKSEHKHGLNMTEEDFKNCHAMERIDGSCPYMGDEQLPESDPRVAENHTELNQIPANHLCYYHEDYDAVCFLGGNTFPSDGRFYRWGGICKSPHTHVEYADGMEEGGYCNKPGTCKFTAASSDLSDYVDSGDIVATGYSGVYDGQPHGIEVTIDESLGDANVKYGTVEGTYDLDESPILTDVGSMSVYFEVSADGYNTSYTGSATVKITEKEVALTWGDTELAYDGQPQVPAVSTEDFVEGDYVELVVVVEGDTDAVEAGEYIAKAVLAGDDAGNYKLPENASMAFTITKLETPDSDDVDGDETGDADGTDDDIIYLTPNEDGTYSDKDGNIYILVDEDGDGEADFFVEVKPNEDGTYSDDANGDGIFGGAGDNTYVSNGDGIFVLAEDDPEITETGDEDKDTDNDGAEDENDPASDTGDNASPLLWFMIMMAAAGTAVVTRKIRA